MRNFIEWSETVENSFIAYHQTSAESAKKILRYGFNTKKSINGIIWFTTDIGALKAGSIGAQGNGTILKVRVTINNPAGWAEYGKLLLFQLKSQGFDGAILKNKDGTFDGFVFDKNNIKALEIVNLGE